MEIKLSSVGGAACRFYGVKLREVNRTRQHGQRPKSYRLTLRVLELIDEGRSYRWIARDFAISKNTVGDIVKRSRSKPLEGS